MGRQAVSKGVFGGEYEYTLGLAGNRIKVVEDTGRVVEYEYDATYKLVGETITAPDGTVVQTSYTYDAVGNRLTKDNNGTLTTYTYDANDRILDENGKNYTCDANAGFHYLRARYMNPHTGRFFTMDTYEGNAFEPASLHKYLYCSSDPINNIDPSGNETLPSMLTAISIRSQLFVSTMGARVGVAIGRLWRTIGLQTQRFAEQVISLFPRLSVIANPQAGGGRILDYLVKSSDKVIMLEVKYNIPSKGTQMFSRVISQLTNAVGSSQGQTVLWTLKEPTQVEIRNIIAQLGSTAHQVQFVHGVEGLYKYLKFFFGM